MAGFEQSVAWWCVAKSGEPLALMRQIAEIGYAAIELVGEEHWQSIRDCGLRIAAIPGHQSLGDGLNKRENHDRIERELLANLKLAVKWGIPNLICFSGNRHGLDDAAGLEITAAGLKRVARAAEDAGVTLVLELLNSKVDHKDYQCDRTPWGVEVCDRVGSPRVKLLYDLYHMQIMEGDIIRTIRQYHTYFGHYHTAGNPGRHDLDDEQELNYGAIMRAIHHTGYAGYVGQEFVPKDKAIPALRAAYELCHIEQEEP